MYRIIKKIHKYAIICSLICFFFASSISDFAKELGEGNPKSVNTLILIGAVLTLPTLIYIASRSYLERRRNRRA